MTKDQLKAEQNKILDKVLAKSKEYGIKIDIEFLTYAVNVGIEAGLDLALKISRE